MKKWYESAFCNKLAAWIAGYFIFAAVWCLCCFLYFECSFMPAWQYLQSGEWDRIPCTITQSAVTERFHGRSRKRYFVPDINFRYEYQGKQYISNQFAFPEAPNYYERRGKSAMRDFPEGKEMLCWVNPRKPTEAVLLRHNVSALPDAIFFGGFLLLPLAGAILYPFWLCRKQPRIIYFSTTAPLLLWLPLIGLFGVMVWSGIVSVSVWGIACGLGLAGGCFWAAWRQVFRLIPQKPPILTLTTIPQWGGMLEFDWAVPPASKLESFELKLIGEKSRSVRITARTYTIQTDIVLNRHLQRWSAGRKRNKPRTGHVSTPLPNSEMELTLDSSAHGVLRLELTGRTFRGKTCEWAYTLTISTQPEAKR